MDVKIALLDIYGSSYFGSGAAGGRVRCCANCRPGGTRDNGFVAGPDYVEVIDPDLPAEFRAGGSDFIGGDVRHWGESARWIPGEGWKR